MNNHIFLPSFAMENTPKIHSSRIRSRNCRMKHNNDFSYFTLDVNSKNTIFPDDISRGRFKNNKMKVSSVPTSPNNKQQSQNSIKITFDNLQEKDKREKIIYESLKKYRKLASTKTNIKNRKDIIYGSVHGYSSQRSAKKTIVNCDKNSNKKQLDKGFEENPFLTTKQAQTSQYSRPNTQRSVKSSINERKTIHIQNKIRYHKKHCSQAIQKIQCRPWSPTKHLQSLEDMLQS